MSEETQWFVLQGEEQLGPYTGAQLVEFATNGNITRESPVWAEGMENWLPADQVEGLFPPAAPPAPMPGAPAYAMAGYGAPPADPSAPYPTPSVGSASFGLWIGLLLGGIVIVIVGFLLGGVVGRGLSESSGEEISSSTVIGGVAALVVIILGCITTMLSTIPLYMTLYRAWKCIQPGGLARTTPGKAVGFMFIPFFNIYWMFQAIVGLATDWNRTVETFVDLKSAPRLSRGMFLASCIPPLGLIMMFPVVSQMCRGVNFFAFRPHPGQGVFGGAGTSGGFQIGGGFTKY